MLQRWQKRGLLLAPQEYGEQLVSHAMVPIVDHVAGDHYRLYFTGRDVLNRSHTWIADLHLGDPPACFLTATAPCLSPGDLGMFDDSGAIATWLVTRGGVKYLYYNGWNLSVTVPFRYAIGLAISHDGGTTYTRYALGPILDRSPVDPCLTATACVLVGDDLWQMWYVSGVRWELEAGRPKHYYHIKYAFSRDGVQWHRPGTVCIDFRSTEEYAFSRPCVLHRDGRYQMWYSYRGASYRIGYAESLDGLHWDRRDEQVGLDVSEAGWDAEMIEYPLVFEHRGRTYILYNGNGYGASGIGYAVLD
jgi:hypothetical protein